MLEGHSLSNKKHYLSNRILRVQTPDGQNQPSDTKLGSEISYKHPKNTFFRPPLSNILIGDADTLFLVRQNDKLQQEVMELISDIQQNKSITAEVQLSSRLQSELLAERNENQNKNVLIRRLLRMSGQLVQLVRQKCKVVGATAKIIKKLQLSMANLSHKFEQTQNQKRQLSAKCLALEKQLLLFKEIKQNSLSKCIQTDTAKVSHFQVQVQHSPLICYDYQTQTQRKIYQSQAIQALIATQQKQTSTPFIALKDQDCSTIVINNQQVGVQFGSATANLHSLSQQTQQYLTQQKATNTHRSSFVQNEVQTQETMVLQLDRLNNLAQRNRSKLQEKNIIEKCQKSVQTESSLVIESTKSQQLSICSHQMIKIEPKIRYICDESTQISIKYNQKQAYTENSLVSKRFKLENLEIIKLNPQSRHFSDKQTQIQLQLVQQYVETQQKTFNSIETMTKVTQNGSKAMQTQTKYSQAELVTNSQETKDSICAKGKFQINKQLNMIIQQRCKLTLQTDVTQQDDALQKIGLPDKQKSQNIVGYFKQISSLQNEISYNEQIVKDLQKNGQNEASIALARLLKEHMYLKVCLNRMIDKQHEQEEKNNLRFVELMQDNMQVTQQLDKDDQSAAKQCTIY